MVVVVVVHQILLPETTKVPVVMPSCCYYCTPKLCLPYPDLTSGYQAIAATRLVASSRFALCLSRSIHYHHAKWCVCPLLLQPNSILYSRHYSNLFNNPYSLFLVHRSWWWSTSKPKSFWRLLFLNSNFVSHLKNIYFIIFIPVFWNWIIKKLF